MEPMHKINKVEVRNLQIEDYIQLSQSFKRVYADKDVFWTHEQIETLIRIFPEGQVVTVVDDKIVGCALSIIVDYDMVKQADGTGPGGDAAAHAHKHRHVTDRNDGLGNDRLRSEGVDGDDGVGVDVFDDGHVCGKGQGLDPPPEDADAAALTDTGRQHQRVAAQGTGVAGDNLCHRKLLSGATPAAGNVPYRLLRSDGNSLY